MGGGGGNGALFIPLCTMVGKKCVYLSILPWISTEWRAGA